MMPCYHPIPARQDKRGAEVILWPPVGTATHELQCGQCIGCKSIRAQDWGRRAAHEAKTWPQNAFVTLTYDEEHLPKDGQLEPKALHDFIRRLRHHRYRHLGGISDSEHGVRYLACGEYGDRNGRPHYHACLFNVGFLDAYEVEKGYTESPTLKKLWPYGQHRIGELTGASANYVAQYTMKKIGRVHCNADGEVLEPPFLRMSTKPYLGAGWLARFKADLRHGYLVHDGMQGRVPRTYKNKLREIDGRLAEEMDEGAAKYRPPSQDLRAAEVIHKRRVELAKSHTL